MKTIPFDVEDMNHILAETREVWGNARENRILLTGGTGFFGKWLASSFIHANASLKLGAELTILSRNTQKAIDECPWIYKDQAIRMVEGDLATWDPCLDDGHKFHYILHGANSESMDTNVVGTLRMRELANWQSNKRLLFLSSGAVDDLHKHGTRYAMGKLVCEELVLRHQRGCVANIYAVVGPGMPLDEHYAIGNFIRDALKGGPIVVRSNGKAKRSYLYMADAVARIWTVLLYPKIADRKHVVGSPDPISLGDLAHLVSDVVLGTDNVKILGEEPAYDYLPHVANKSSACTCYLRKAIARTVDWYRRAGR